MGAMEVASLFASLSIKDNATNPLKDVRKNMQGATDDAKTAERSVGGLGSALSGLGNLAASIGFAGFFADAIGGAREAALVSSQLDAVLESTSKSTVKVRNEQGKWVPQLRSTRESVLATSAALMDLTGIDDDTITSAQNLLLTFTSIGKDVMPDATLAVLDMAAAMKTDEKSAALMIGKALQSAEGVTALTRAGVQFTAAEERKIKALFASGRAAEAQKMILAELAKEFGGSAASQADGITRLQTGWGNFVETVGGVVLPVIQSVALILNDVLTALTPFIPQIAAVAGAFGLLATATGPVGVILGAILGPIGAIGIAAAALAVAWNTNFLGLRDAVDVAWKYIQPGLDLISKGLSGMFDAFTKPDISGMAGGDMAADALAALDTRSLGDKFAAALKAGLPVIIEGFKSLLQGVYDFATNEGVEFLDGAIKQIFKFTNDIVAWVNTNAPNIIWGVMDWLEGARNWLAEQGPGLISEGVQAALNFASSIVQFVATHMPDLTFAIGGWIGTAVDWLFVEAPILIQNAVSGLLSGVSVDGSGLMTALGSVFGADGPIWALFDGLFGEDKGTIGLKVGEFFGEGGTLAGIIEGSIVIVQTIWDKLFGKEGGLMITINTLKGLVEGVFTALRASVMSILKGLLSPLITLLKAVAIIADAIGNTELRAAAGKAALDIEGMRASGGPVKAGKNYIIGENGAEIFQPSTNGSIISNSAAFGSGGMGGSINISAVYISGTDNPAVFFDKMQAEAKRRNLSLGGAM